MLVGYYPINRGGAEYQSYLIAQELKKRNYVFYISVGHNENKVFHEDGFRIYTLKAPSFVFFNKLYFLLKDKMFQILKNEKPDVVYQRVCYSATGIAAKYCKNYNSKMIWHISHDNDVMPLKFNFKKQIIFDYIDKKVAEYGIRNCSKIIGQTKDQNKLLKKHYSRKCDAIIPNFHPFAAREVEKKDPVKILWVANFKHFKHPEIFIEVAKHFEGLKNVRFYMIGRRESKKHETQIEDKIANIKNLEHLGERSLEEVNEFFCKAHIFVNTSDFEGFPNTFIQAWMRRVPVVSLNVDPDNILKNHGIGLHSGCFEQLVKDTRRLIEDEHLRETMGKKGQEYAFRNHSLANIEKIVELIHE